MAGELRALAELLVSMDDPESPAGLEARRTATLSQLIGQARAALEAEPVCRWSDDVREDVAALLRDNVQTLDKGEEWYLADMLLARLATPNATPAVTPVGFQERVTAVLIQHQRQDAGSCLCGWDVLGASHSGHVARVLADHDVIGDAALVVERVRKAFNDMWSGPDWEGQVSMGFAATFDQEIDKVLADFAPTTNDLLAAISTWIDNSQPYQEASPELADTWRVIKMAEEVGEAVGALMGAMGENPRKGVTHTRADVEHEILDVAAAGLGALMHFHDNDPAADVLGYLIEHIRTRAIRGVPHGLVMPAGKEPLLLNESGD